MCGMGAARRGRGGGVNCARPLRRAWRAHFTKPLASNAESHGVMMLLAMWVCSSQRRWHLSRIPPLRNPAITIEPACLELVSPWMEVHAKWSCMVACGKLGSNPAEYVPLRAKRDDFGAALYENNLYETPTGTTTP